MLTKHLFYREQSQIDWQKLWQEVAKNKIESLDLGKGKFTHIEFPSFPLPSLKVLDLSHSQTSIENLSIPATCFPNLEYLFVYKSKLKSFSIKGTLPKLKELNLEGNEISVLDLSNIIHFAELKTLFLYGNPLSNIPKEIFDKKTENVLQVVRDFAKYTPEEIAFLREGKMILIGNGKVGKTSIRLKLLDKQAVLPKDKDRTQGIEVSKEKYKVEDIEVDIYEVKDLDFYLHIWDFGGQGKYREVQQLFCSRKSLYLFVTSTNDDTQDEDYVGFEYWLSMASAFSYDKDSQKYSPIIYVLNKIDICEEGINEKDIKGAFDNVETFLKISCEKLINFDALEKAIKDTLPKVSKDIFTTPFPKPWLAVKKDLEEEESEGKTHIFYNEYLGICAKQNIEAQEARTLLQTLDLMGYLIYYGENEKLNDWIILNPRWVKDAIYKVLDNKSVIDHYGVFRPSNFPHIWHDYKIPKPFLQRVTEFFRPDDKNYTNPEREKLLNLMLAYEFCYERQDLRGKPYYLIPTLFGEKPPMPSGLPDLNKKIRFVYEPFIPAGTVNKLIVRLHQKIYEKEFRWKNGVLFEENSAFAEVTEDWKNKVVWLSMGGENLENLYQSIAQTLEDLNQDLRRTKFLEKLTFRIEVLYQTKWIDSETLKYIPQNGFEFILSKGEEPTKTNIDMNLKKILEKIEENNYQGYFDEMDKVAIPSHFKPQYAQKKGIFISGQAPFDFHGQLTTLTREIFKSLVIKVEEEKDNTPISPNNYTLLMTLPIKVEEEKDNTPISTPDFKEEAYKLLEDGSPCEALKVIMKHTRGTKIHPTVIAINASCKEYEKDKLAGRNVNGRLEDITSRVTELLEKHL